MNLSTFIIVSLLSAASLTAGDFRVGPFCEPDHPDPVGCVGKLMEDWSNRDGMLTYEIGSAISRSFCAHPQAVLRALARSERDADAWLASLGSHTFWVGDHADTAFGSEATTHLRELKICMIENARSLVDHDEVGPMADRLLQELRQTTIRYVDESDA